MIEKKIIPGKKIFFASDFHLGVPDHKASLEREKKIVSWLRSVEAEAQELFLMGDVFDFWFEYRHAVPKGYIRLLGQLARMADLGIPIHYFTGNHDLWMRDYLVKEINATIYSKPQLFRINNKVLYLAHGDGLGPGDHKYKMIKKVFTNRFCQWLFRNFHPDWGISLANYFSARSRAAFYEADKEFLGEDKEWLIIHSKDILKDTAVDYFVFGHRHYPIELPLGKGSTYVNLGDWLEHCTYAYFDGNKIKLETWDET